MHSLLSNAACFSLPSSHEGLPIALLEAMSYRLPVVVSDIPANLEVGLPDGDYFPTGDIDTLASRIRSKIDNGPQRIDYSLGKYDWDNIAMQVASVYGAPYSAI